MDISFNAATRRRLLLGAAAFLGTLAGSRAGHAVVIRDRDAEALVSRLVEHVLQVISSNSDGSSQERRLMAAIESQTDLSLLARMTMGRYWRQASAKQRETYVGVFRHYLLQSFTSRLRRYTGTDLGAAQKRFAILGTRDVGKSDMLVRSRIEPPSGAPLKVDWRIRSRGGRLFIIDLVVEGVSLVITQRSEFSSVLERIGIDGLITELQTRVARSI